MVCGVAVVDDLFEMLLHGPESRAHVVIDIARQVCDSVGEDLLPQRGLVQRLLRIFLALFKIRLSSPRGRWGR